MSKAFKRFVARPAAEYAPAQRRAKRAAREPDQENEATLARDIVAYLRELGWHVVVFSSHKPQAASIAGWPDIVAFWRDHALLVECKTARGSLLESQVAFADALAAVRGQHIMYIVARSINDVMRCVEDRRLYEQAKV